MEFSQGRALGWQGNLHLAGVHIDRRNQYETVFPSPDLPVIVLAQQMVMSTEQNSVVDVRAAAVSCPVFGVVGLCPGWRSLTSGEPASAIANRESSPLLTRVQLTFTTHVEGVIAVVEKDRLDRRRTESALDGLDAHGIELALEVAVAIRVRVAMAVGMGMGKAVGMGMGMGKGMGKAGRRRSAVQAYSSPFPSHPLRPLVTHAPKPSCARVTGRRGSGDLHTVSAEGVDVALA